MTLWRRVTPGIVRVSLVSAFAGTCAIFFAVATYALHMFSTHVPSLMEPMDSLAARCAQEPAGFVTEVSSGDLVRTWDAARLPTDGSGPDARLLEKLRAGAPSAMRLLWFHEYGGVLLFQRGAAGPCSLVEVYWRIDRRARFGLGAMALLLALMSALFAGLLSALVVVRPVIERVQRLGRAARRVGEAPYLSASDEDEDELGLLSRQLDAAHARIRAGTEALIERNRNLESNLADVAHDLKTPLSAVQLALESLAATRKVEDDPESKRATARRCLEDCVYLAAMIDNLRVGSQLADGVDPGEGGARAELGQHVEQVVRRLRPLGRWRGVEVDRAEAGREVWVGCRPLALERVIDNLVANAVRHGRPGDHVAILLEAKDGGFVLTVLDDGPGLPEAERTALTQRGFRGFGAEQKAPQGTGLGLAIVAEVCRRCGWELSFEANAPSGLRVEVRGPVLAAPDPSLPPHSVQERSVQPTS